MQLTINEKIAITRHRLGLRQGEFWKGIIYQQGGSRIENNTWAGRPSRMEHYIKKICAKYDCEPKNITVNELIRISRARLNLSKAVASILLMRTEQWLINVEQGIDQDDKMLLVYYKLIYQQKNT